MEATCQCTSTTIHLPSSGPSKVYICHCTHCQAQSSSAFGISAMFPASVLSTPENTTTLANMGIYTRPTESGGVMECYFCKVCGVRIVHRRRGEVEGNVSVKGGALRGVGKEVMRRWLEGAVQLWCKEAVVGMKEGGERWEGEPE